MRTFCFKNCRIKHVKIGFLVLSAIGVIILIIIPSVYPMSMINGGLLRGISFGIGFLLGKEIYLLHPIGRCLAKLFPFSCGHRKRIYTGSSSMPLQAILLLIDSCLPTMEEMEQLKSDAMDFLCDIKTELEKEFTQTTFECIFSGSIEERFGIPYSHKKAVPSQFNALYTDFDIMFCCDFYNASFYSKGNVLIEHCRVDENFILPGFAKLRYFAHSPDEQLLDSNEFLQKVLKAVKCAKVEHLPGDSCSGACATPVSTTIRGPSVKVCVFPDWIKKRFEGDITICIKCFEWPLISNWPIRENRSWPSTENVQEIASHGFHLVAKPLRYNREIIPVWRFSFSVAEIELSKLVPDTARKCFLALKVILRDHLQPVFPELSSYHIKTIFLNTLEKMPENVWVDENIEECFLTLLKELQNALESGYCRHFWLKDVNLFTYLREEKRKMLKLLSTKVKHIIEVDPAPFIYDDGCCCICSCCRCVTKKEHYREESQNILPVGDDTGGAEVKKNQGTNRGYGTFLKAHEVV